MTYQQVKQGNFLSRENRFIAHCTVDGRTERVHVRNTGRCRELLIPGAPVWLEDMGLRENRATRYSLVAVEKDGVLFNLDSQAPNLVAEEALRAGELDRFFPVPPTGVSREYAYGQSRLDLTCLCGERRALIEVKGVTLEEQGVLYFPDAPTLRGVKHVEELARAAGEGLLAYLLFIIQTEHAKWMEPNRRTHPEFAQALARAADCGVRLLAFTCRVTPGRLTLFEEVSLKL